MNDFEILEIADSLKRASHRVRNSGDVTLANMGLKLANKAKKQSTVKHAKEIETEYLWILKDKYLPILPSDKQITVVQMSGYDTPSNDDNSIPPDEPNDVEKLDTHAPQTIDTKPGEYINIVENLSNDTIIPMNSDAASTLASIANIALENNLENCSGSTSEVASSFGHSELVGLDANHQVQYMKDNWVAVDAHTAQEIANQGGLVVAGLEAPEGHHGHTTIVTPGQGETKKDGSFYPNVTGGAMNEIARSDGDKTVGRIWNNHDRANVGYYIPPRGE